MASDLLINALRSAAGTAVAEGGPAEGQTVDEFLGDVDADLSNDEDLAQFFEDMVDAAWEEGYSAGYREGSDDETRAHRDDYDNGYDEGYDQGFADRSAEDDED